MEDFEHAQTLSRIGGSTADDVRRRAKVVEDCVDTLRPVSLPPMPAEIRGQHGEVATWSDAAWAALAEWRLAVSAAEADGAARLEALLLQVRALRDTGDASSAELAARLAITAGKRWPRLVRLLQERHEGQLPDLVTLRKLCRITTLDLSHLPMEWRLARKTPKPAEPAPRKRGSSWGGGS
jgi:hypothetical protein